MVAEFWFRVAVMFLLAFAGGCGRPGGNLTAVFGSEYGIATIRNATTVKAFRIKSPAAQHEVLSDYEMITGPLDVSESAASELRELLLDPAIYGWDTAKGCIPDFGVRIQFQRESDTVDVLLCFECDILTVFHIGKYVGGEDFDEAHSEFVAILKGLFKDDEVIQGL